MKNSPSFSTKNLKFYALVKKHPVYSISSRRKGARENNKRGAINDSRGTNGPEENNPSCDARGSIIIVRNRRTRVSNGHLSRREHALSRAAAYEKAPRRNN